MSRSLDRREFLRRAAMAGVGGTLGLAGCESLAPSKRLSPNERLNIGMVGVMHRAAEDLKGVESENIVALCDIDDNYIGAVKQRFPQAKIYNDFRKLLDQNDIDAVVIGTPDHTHLVAAVGAMKLGKHVYCEKPLGHNVYEVRVAAETARRMKVATQMGTQIHAGDNYRRVVEVIKSGAIGKIADVHVWVGKDWSGADRPKETPPVPPNLHWDLWLGPAPERPYHPTYLPQEWRRWWDFGGGTLADMGCHYIDLVFWALDLRHPLTVEAEGPPVNPETAPKSLKVHWTFPARGALPPLNLTWYDGELRPPLLARKNIQAWDAGVLFIGDRGMMLANYDTYRLLPEADFAGYKPPAPSIPPSIGHHKEWIQACKTDLKTLCNFDYAGALTETVLLGNVAYRTGKKLHWDHVKLRATDCPEADHFIRREYRKGWSL
ncbi:Gfo/Idh/MocA family oxidoreductase [Candidatus Sumerlaeota bacterium]|nr:Gfo/Idh/MocA family oxidoreductase [Candidatus Sumerlaeota bacterium]